MVDRKPKSKESADVILNKFLTKNGILLATEELPVSRSTDGSITVRPSKPVAIYEADVKAAAAAKAASSNQPIQPNQPIVSKNGEAKK